MNKKKDEGEEDLDDYIYNNQMENILKEYLPYIKGIISLIDFFCAMSLIIFYLLGQFSTKEGITFMKIVSFLVIYLTTCILVITRYPKTISFMIPLTQLAIFIAVTHIELAHDEYTPSEWFNGVVGLGTAMHVSVPIKWKYFCLSFVLGVVYHIISVYIVYGFFPVTLVGSSIGFSSYFIFASGTLNTQFRGLYLTLFTKNRLLNDIRWILEIFPEGVFMINKDKDAKENIIIRNKEFLKHIGNIQDDIAELK